MSGLLLVALWVVRRFVSILDVKPVMEEHDGK